MLDIRAKANYTHAIRGTVPKRPVPLPRAMTWRTSTRRSRLPANWPAIRQAVLLRDHSTCHVCGQADADEVDHIESGDDHTPANLAAIHSDPCHRNKSSAEGHRARGQGPTRERPPEQHPGTIGTA